MTESYLVPLGQGLVRADTYSGKAARLDRAKRAGLPVPNGYVLPEEAVLEAERDGLIEADSGRIHVDDLQALIDELHVPGFPDRVAVRSAFSAEDSRSESLAGFFVTRLGVNPRDSAALANALADVWCSADRVARTRRRDVLLQEMVVSRHAGVAFTERVFEDDRVNYIKGMGDRLASGKETGSALDLPKLRSWETQSAGKEQRGFAQRLQRLLRDVRRVFGEEDWDVEWADDGVVCWLLQIRPITRPLRRNEAFTNAIHKEILPRLPSRFMTSVIASCSQGVFDYYRIQDKRLSGKRPFIEVFKGRPYFNLSLSVDMLRLWGLPTHIASAWGHLDGKEYGLRPSRLVRNLAVTARLCRQQFRTSSAARRSAAQIKQRTMHPGATFSELLESLRWVYVSLVHQMLGFSTALRGPASALRRLRALEVHDTPRHPITSGLYPDLHALQGWVQENQEVKPILEQGIVPDAPAFIDLWEACLEKHGHRGMYECDIARPRYHEAPEPLLRWLAAAPNRRGSKNRRGWGAWITYPLWWQARRTLRAREALRSEAMRAFDRIRGALIRRWESSVGEGTSEHLWLLDIDQVRSLDQGWRPDPDVIEDVVEERRRLRNYHMPDVLRRFDDLDEAAQATPDRIPYPYLTGVSLTSGNVKGRAWIPDEPGAVLPEGFDGSETILVARSVDSGWITACASVAGIVVETGGELSHGSILLRELGLPAVTNVSQATTVFRTGEQLLLRAGEGVVLRT